MKARLCLLALTLLVAAPEAFGQPKQPVNLGGTWFVTGTYKAPGDDATFVGTSTYGGFLRLSNASPTGAVKVHAEIQLPARRLSFDSSGRWDGTRLTFKASLGANGLVGGLTGASGSPGSFEGRYRLGAAPDTFEGGWVLSTGESGTDRLTRADPIAARALALTPGEEDRALAAETARFGMEPHHWLGYVMSPDKDALLKALRKAVARTGNRLSLTWLYTIAMGEGLILYVQDIDGEPHDIDPGDFSLSGFAYLGTDNFGSEAASLKAKGYLPQDFALGREYRLENQTNELGEPVVSATYHDLTAGLTALAAMIIDRRDRFYADASSIWGEDARRKLTPDQIRFWSYLDFNMGSGGRASLMRKHAANWGQVWGPHEVPSNMNARYNSILRVSTARWLDDLHVFADR